jgi:hypothetical protein
LSEGKKKRISKFMNRAKTMLKGKFTVLDVFILGNNSDLKASLSSHLKKLNTEQAKGGK